ncbi:alpha/beta hydrolase family protein [Mucilaginibacter antarcticus]|uniref:alpha/beta hydrolase family protein n=1 Tax=Mucilaginibacter antarcticus TaxID=1855725 RepID=UPI00362A326E
MNLKTVFLLPLCFAVCIYKLSAQALPSKTRWEGKLGELKIVLRVFEDSVSKENKAEIDVPQQMALGLKVSKLTITNDSITAFIQTINAGYKGRLNAAKTELTGTWQQGGGSIPLILKQVSAEIKRLQTPKAPFPYLEEKIVYYNQDKSIQYGATLTLPKSAKPVPAVILITGSGPEDRDETIFDHKPFWVIADHLSRNGIAVLRVDDRGVGQTTGGDPNATSADFAKDVLVGIDYLKKHAGIDTKNIGLIGHSEGGVIAPLAALQSNDVAFIISLAGIGVKGSDIMHKQKYDAYKKTGQFTEDELSKITALDKGLMAAAAKTTSNEELSALLKNVFTEWKAQQTESFLKKWVSSDPMKE